MCELSAFAIAFACGMRERLPAPPRYCNLSTISPVAIALRPSENGTRHFLDGYRRVLGRLHTHQAVDGHNHTETIETLLDEGIAFHDLSKLGRRWGMLGNWLSHYSALKHQLSHALPFMLLLEDDVYLRPAFLTLLEQQACEAFNAPPRAASSVRSRPGRRSLGKQPQPQQPQPQLPQESIASIVQISRYSEITLTSLAGARLLVELMRAAGVRKSIDQQLLDPAVMGSATGRYHTVAHIPAQQKGVAWKARPWVLGRQANSADGHIWRSRRFTWTEMAMLRMLTQGTATVRRLRLHGNPRLPADKPQTWAH